MKPSTKRLLAVIIAVCIFSFGCAANETNKAPAVPDFHEAAHERTPEYPAQFSVYAAETEQFSLNIQTTGFDEALSHQAFGQVSEDLARVSQALAPAPRQPAIYVVTLTISGTTQRVGDRIYCTMDDILRGEYREALLCAAFDITEPWIATGIQAYVFDDGEADSDDQQQLTAYYNREDGRQMLTLFGGYFTAFASEEEQGVARATAVSLCRYILEEHGLDELLSKGYSYLGEWMSAAGIEGTFENPYAGCFDGYRYSSSDKHPLIITTPRNDVFYFKHIENSLDTVPQVEQALFELAEGVRSTLAYLHEHAPDYYDMVADNYAAPIEYYVSSEYGDASHALLSKRVVRAGGGEAFLHETVHVMIPTLNESIQTIWQEEAIAQYLPAVADTQKADKMRFYKALTDERLREDSTDAAAQFGWLVKQIYSGLAPLPESWEDVDILLFDKAVAAACMQRYDLKRALKKEGSSPHVTLSVKERRGRTQEAEGDDLSYPEAADFASFLIDRCGLSALLRYCMETQCSFRDAFGEDYAVMQGMWRKGLLALPAGG